MHYDDPPPYSEHDPNSASNTDTACVDTPRPIHTRSESSFSKTPGKNLSDTHQLPTLYEDQSSCHPVSGSPYFIMRSVSRPSPVNIISHRIIISSEESPDRRLPPQLKNEFSLRDVNDNDWSAFLGHVFPDRQSNSELNSKSLAAFDVRNSISQVLGTDASLHLQTPASTESMSSTSQSLQVRREIYSAIREWNLGFFLPRGILIVPKFTLLPRLSISDIDSRGSSGATVILQAVKDSNLALIERLLLYGANPDIAPTGGQGPVYHCVETMKLPMLRLLLSYGAQPDKKPTGTMTPFHRAASKSRLELVKLLAIYGADVNSTTIGQRTALHDATVRRDLPMVGWLAAYGADVNKCPFGSESPLSAVAKRGDLDLLDILLKHGANVDFHPIGGATPAYQAAQKGDTVLLRKFIEYGANLDLAPMGSPTPLGIAVNKGDIDTARLLLESGAKVDTKPLGGETPLHIAASRGDWQMMGLLFTYKANIERNLDKSVTAFSKAIISKNDGGVESFATHGADILIQYLGGMNGAKPVPACINSDSSNWFAGHQSQSSEASQDENLTSPSCHKTAASSKHRCPSSRKRGGWKR